MKRIICCALLAMLLMAASACAESGLQDGIYIFKHKGYYAFDPSEEVSFPVFIAYANESMSPDTFYGYRDFEFVSSEDKTYPVTFSDFSIEMFTSAEQSVEPFFSNCTIYGIPSVDGITTLTGFSYIAPDGKRYIQDIGRMDIEFIEKGADDIVAGAMEISYFTIGIPVIDSTRLSFESDTDRECTINELSYGWTNVKVDLGEELRLPAGGSVEREFEVAMDEDPEDEIIVYAMKPKYYYTVDGQEKVGVFHNTSSWAYIIDFDLDVVQYIMDNYALKEM